MAVNLSAVIRQTGKIHFLIITEFQFLSDQTLLSSFNFAINPRGINDSKIPTAKRYEYPIDSAIGPDNHAPGDLPNTSMLASMV